MIDLKWIREYPDQLDLSLKKRGMEAISDHILKLDLENRKFITEIQQLRAKKKLLSEEIGKYKRQGGECKLLSKEAEALKAQEEALEQKAQKVSAKLEKILEGIPNILDKSVPVGEKEADNIEIRKWKEPSVFPWIKDHMRLGLELGGMDSEQALEVSGSRFIYLKGDISRLERALANWMLDLHAKEAGFVEVSPPYLVKKESVFGVGQLPKFEKDLFQTTDGRFLISTSEVVLANLAREKIFEEEVLPFHFMAYTPCFRSEAGSAGKDTHGMMRMHQFNKVELVSICKPEDSFQELELLVQRAERILRLLELPYRVMLLCSGDTGFCSAKTYDLEVWVPSEKRYREISSCSNCLDFQARRMQGRFRDSSKKGISYLHMLNASALAVGRTLLAVLENYQQEDGSIVIPQVLVPYFGKKERIERL